MAHCRLKETKDGRRFYEIIVSRGRGKSQLTKRWYVPDGWSQKAIDRELTAVAADFERQVDNGEVLSRSERKARAAQEAQEAAKILTLKQYGESVFLPYKAVTMAENSRYTYENVLVSWIYPELGALKMPDITAAHITALLLGVQAKGKAHATVLKVYTVLQGLFKLAYKTDIIDRNPMDKVDRPKPRKDEYRDIVPESYTAEQVQQLLVALESEPLLWRTLVHVLIDTGIRRGECCALRWENVDLSTGVVTISGNLCYTPKKGVYLDTSKTARRREVFLGEESIALLQKLRSEVSGGAESGYIFTNDGIKPINPQTPTAYLHKLVSKYNLPPLHPHLLRHTFASIAITAGADIASVSEVMGHTDKAVTLRMYTHASEESKMKSARIFREAIKTNTKPIQTQETKTESANEQNRTRQEEKSKT